MTISLNIQQFNIDNTHKSHVSVARVVFARQTDSLRNFFFNLTIYSPSGFQLYTQVIGSIRCVFCSNIIMIALHSFHAHCCKATHRSIQKITKTTKKMHSLPGKNRNTIFSMQFHMRLCTKI